MKEQKLKDFCIQALKKVPVPKDMRERVRVATDFADRLFIADYLSKENRTNFIKNELCSYFDLKEEEVNKIITSIDLKEAIIQDKLQIAKFKNALNGLQTFDYNEWFRCNNILEVKKIIEYIRTNYTFTNYDIFKSFVKKDLCQHFSLTEEEKKEVMEEV